jgi:hypothetical protein
MPMDPHECSSVVSEVQKYFPEISLADCERLARRLEPYPRAVADEVLERYVDTTSKFDRATFFRLLGEEHQRRMPNQSRAAQWKKEKQEDVKRRDDSLSRLSDKDREDVIKRTREKYPDAFRFLHCSPFETDFGRSLLYSALREQLGDWWGSPETQMGNSKRIGKSNS